MRFDRGEQYLDGSVGDFTGSGGGDLAAVLCGAEWVVASGVARCGDGVAAEGGDGRCGHGRDNCVSDNDVVVLVFG